MKKNCFYPVLGKQKSLPVYLSGIGVADPEYHIKREKGLISHQFLYTQSESGQLLVNGKRYLPKEGTETNLPEEELPTEPVQTPQPTVTPTQEPTMIPTPQPTQIPQPTAGTSPTQKPTTETIKKGTNWKINGMVFEVTNAKKKTVKCKKAISKKVKKATIPAVVVVSTKSGKQSFTVTEIAPKAFSNCKKLKKVVIGKNVTQIGKEAFSKDSSLQKITFQTTKLKKVGKNAIKGIAKKAVLTCPKKSKKAYQKIFTKKTGFQTKMKWK